ncbi:hypothetical protein D1007_25064 [Hordeum vulgare]|nr:hypothetical protein D1007_25064 [Hordeum vulgare]
MHQARWHWEHHIPLSYPDATLSHHSHLDPERILVQAVARSTRMHAKEVSRPRRLMPEQRLNPLYVADSSNLEVWFVVEHEEQRRRGVHDMQPGPPAPPPIVHDEDQEAEAAYQAALAATLRESEEKERRKAEEADVAYEAQLAEAIAMSIVGDCVVPPLSKSEPQPEVYEWTACLHEWVSVPPIWLGATPQQEAACLQHWRALHVARSALMMSGRWRWSGMCRSND